MDVLFTIPPQASEWFRRGMLESRHSGVGAPLSQAYASHFGALRVAERDRGLTSVVKVVGVSCLLTAPWWIYYLIFCDYEAYDFLVQNALVSLRAILAIVVINLLFVRAAIRRDLKAGLPMIVGYMLKLASSAIFLYLVLNVYEGAADMVGYFRQGAQLASGYEATGDLPYMTPFWSSNFVKITSGYLILLFGFSVSTLMVVFATIGFWGQYFFYRAFCIGFPEGDRFRAAVLIFLLPSIFYWTSFIGKDALMMLGLGLVSFGFALLTRRSALRAIPPLLVGLGITLAVRPHISALVCLAMASTYLLGKNRRGIVGAIAKIIGIPILVAGSFYLIEQAKAFVDLQDVSQTAKVLKETAHSTRLGGSQFGSNSVGVRIAYAPFLLFRPFPWEIHNLPSLVASLEGLFLMILAWLQRRRILAVAMHFRSKPFTFFILLCIAELSAVLAGGITNFGLLARERVMMMPMAVMLLCVPIASAQWAPAPAHVYFSAPRP